MTPIIIETDIGRDPDDLWAILYLLSAGLDVKAITVAPGDPDQIAIVRFLRDELGADFLIGQGEAGRDKHSCRGDYHQNLLRKYRYPVVAKADGFGPDIINTVMASTPNCEMVIIGPLTSVGQYFRDHPNAQCRRATMQGGFIGYHVHGLPCKTVDKFVGKGRVQTFNLNASKDLAQYFLNANIGERCFVGKHLCHGVVYDEQAHARVMSTPPKNRAAQLLREALGLYLEGHPGGKKFHDPLAAVYHLHPAIAQSVGGRLRKVKGEWGSTLDPEGDSMVIDMDMDAFWRHIAEST